MACVCGAFFTDSSSPFIFVKAAASRIYEDAVCLLLDSFIGSEASAIGVGPSLFPQ